MILRKIKNNKLKYVSPTILIIINFFIALIIVFFPPTIYSKYIYEKDYFYLNYILLFVIFMDLLFLYLGYKLVNMFFPSLSFFKNLRKVYIKPYFYFGVPLIVFEILVVIFIITFIKDNNSLIYSMLIAGQGSSYKEHLINNFYYFSIYILMGIIFWALNEFNKLKRKYFFIKLLIIIGIILIIISSLLMLARFLLIPFILGLSVLILKNDKNFSLKKILFILSIGILIFIILAIFRSFASDKNIWNIIIEQIIGYTMASFNRLALIIRGDLIYTYANTGYYLMPFFAHIPLFHNILPNIYGVTSSKVWLTEFINVGESGLNSAYIWATVYGYIFSVLHYFSFIYFFIVGCFIGISWNSFLEDKIFGIVTYPWIFASLILFFASNIMFLPQFIGLVYAVIFISLWSLIFKIPNRCYISYNY